MKIFFSKADSIDGEFSVDLTGETLGHIQVYGVILNDHHVSVPVTNAGTILIAALKGGVSLKQTWTGTVESIKDVILTAPEAPKRIEVRGVVTLQGTGSPQKIVTNFVGNFHPTSYFQRAWTSLLDPNWDGNWSF